MSVKLYVWQSARGAWLGRSPLLEKAFARWTATGCCASSDERWRIYAGSEFEIIDRAPTEDEV